MEQMPNLPAGATRKRNVFDVLEALKSVDLNGRAPNILVRVDFNVPMQNGVITDASRIKGALPTIKSILQNNANAILVSHMGRPKLVQKGEDNEETAAERIKLSLLPVAEYLRTALPETTVLFADDCMNAAGTIAELPATGGAIALLENLRFYKQEEKNEENFTKTLASYCDAYVNDAFGTSHRAHASVSGVPSLLSPELCGIGSLVASELAFLDFSTKAEGEVIAAIIGGSKVSTKLPVIQGILKSADILVLGGGLAFTFLKAQGVSVGNSLVEDGMIDTAKELMEQAARDGKQLVIPVDAVCSKEFPKGPMSIEDTKTFDLVPEAGIEEGWMGLDVGPKTAVLYKEALSKASKIVLNGPSGVFEIPPFDQGTRALVQILEDLTAAGVVTVVGGGDSVAALEAFGKMDAVTYVSTGGGATLELLAGDILPGVAAIQDFTE